MGNNSLATAKDITATEQSGDSSKGGVLGYLTNPASQSIGGDYYVVNVNAGDNLHFATSTPSGGPAAFQNGLYPELLLFNQDGDLVAVAAGNAADGRNSIIDFTVPQGGFGLWTIEVAPSPNTTNPTQGEYGLLVSGATGSRPYFFVASTNPAPGAIVATPTDFIATFNEPIYFPSLTAGELEINGVAALSATPVNAYTVDWKINPASVAAGTRVANVTTIGADALGNQLLDVSGSTLINVLGDLRIGQYLPDPDRPVKYHAARHPLRQIRDMERQGEQPRYRRNSHRRRRVL